MFIYEPQMCPLWDEQNNSWWLLHIKYFFPPKLIHISQVEKSALYDVTEGTLVINLALSGHLSCLLSHYTWMARQRVTFKQEIVNKRVFFISLGFFFFSVTLVCQVVDMYIKRENCNNTRSFNSKHKMTLHHDSQFEPLHFRKCRNVFFFVLHFYLNLHLCNYYEFGTIQQGTIAV